MSLSQPASRKVNCARFNCIYRTFLDKIDVMGSPIRSRFVRMLFHNRLFQDGLDGDRGLLNTGLCRIG